LVSPEAILKGLNIGSWPIWTKEFDWYYDETEQCYILEGRAIVETPGWRERKE